MSQVKADRESSFILLMRLKERADGFQIGAGSYSMLAIGFHEVIRKMMDFVPRDGESKPVDMKIGDKTIRWWKTKVMTYEPDFYITYVKTVINWWEHEFPYQIDEAEKFMSLLEPFKLDLHQEMQELKNLQKKNDTIMEVLKQQESEVDNAKNPDELAKPLREVADTLSQIMKLGLDLEAFRSKLNNRILDTFKVLLSTMIIPKSQKLYDLFTKEL